MKIHCDIRQDVLFSNHLIYSKEVIEQIAKLSNDQAEGRHCLAVTNMASVSYSIQLSDVAALVQKVEVDINGNLICEVEVLDTPAGRYIKTLTPDQLVVFPIVRGSTDGELNISSEGLSLLGWSISPRKP